MHEKCRGPLLDTSSSSRPNLPSGNIGWTIMIGEHSAGYELWTLKVQCSLFWAIECDWNVFFALDIEAKIRGSKSWCREQLKIHRDQFVVESLSTITIFFNLNLTSPIILRRMSKKEKGSLWDHHQQVKCKGRHLSEIEKKSLWRLLISRSLRNCGQKMPSGSIKLKLRSLV